MTSRMSSLLAAAMLVLGACATTTENSATDTANPYAEYVWPPPPDQARIGLVDILSGRADVEAETKLKRTLLSSSPTSRYDRLLKPHGAAIDLTNRVLVTDSVHGALLRIDRTKGVYDILGTRGSVRLQQPIGLGLGPDGTIYVADIGLGAVAAFNPDGDLRGLYGSKGELENPTDAEVSPDGARLFVADSKAHHIVVFDLATGSQLTTIGEPGGGPGQFHAPTSLAFSPGGELFVVDQLNARVQLMSPEGEFLDQLGSRGIGFGKFVRPKDIAIDDHGLIYVSDAALNNVQIFDVDLSLLTFVGRGGHGPGEFDNMVGVAVRGDQMVLVDQSNRRIQVFRFLFNRDGD